MKVGDVVRLAQDRRRGTLSMPSSWRGLCGLIVEIGHHPQSTKGGWWIVFVSGDCSRTPHPSIGGTTRMFHEDFLDENWEVTDEGG